MTSMKSIMAAVASLVVIGGCGTTQDEAYDASARELDAMLLLQDERSSGETWARVNAQNELTILQSTDGEPQTAEKMFVLTLEGSENLPVEGKLGDSDVAFLPESNLFVLHTNANNSIYLFGLNDEKSREKIGLLKSNPRIRANIKAEVFAHGISESSGSWEQKAGQLDVSVSNFLLPKVGISPEEGGGSGGSTCTSGGTGSSSCSITEWTQTTCSVTCGAGYYACCNSSSVKCTCIKG
jgi:hypothetical protein